MSLKKLFRGFTEGFSSVFDSAESRFNTRIKELEFRFMQVILRIKKKIYRSIFEMLFFGLSIVLLFIGLILFLSRFFPLDLVIIGFALLALYVGLMLRIMK